MGAQTKADSRENGEDEVKTHQLRACVDVQIYLLRHTQFQVQVHTHSRT